ncbi:MAG: DUF1552 domain-containing protein [Myxococcota bacterium]
MGISRRQFVAGLGAGLLAAPFCQLLNSRTAYANGVAKRLLIYFSPNGTIHRHWRPSGSGTNFTFPTGSILEPLSAHKDDLIVIEGLDFFTGNNHEGGMAAMLTNRGSSSTETRGMSLDQFVASRLGGNDRFASLEFGVLTDIWGGGQQTRMSYSGADQIVHPDADPWRAFGRMFGDLTGDDLALARRKERRLKVIDTARGELGDLYRRLGREEKIKLEAHIEALRQVEQSFDADLSCNVPTAPEQLNKDANDNVPAIARAQIDLAVTALACGMTHVASVQLSHTVSPVVFSWAGNSEGHHSLSHSDDGNTHGVQQFVDAERWCAEQFGYLLDRMKAMPNPDGDGSLLDSTVVLWAKEMGDCRAHVCTDVPFVLAGGGFRPGRYINGGGQSHSTLLVSICNALGIDNQTFGDPTTATGGLSELA